MFDWRDYGNGIVAFDAGYVRPVLAAIHMVIENGRVAFIDTGSNDALPNALAALRKLGLDASAVDYVMLTHIHLDHAGGGWQHDARLSGGPVGGSSTRGASYGRTVQAGCRRHCGLWR